MGAREVFKHLTDRWSIYDRPTSPQREADAGSKASRGAAVSSFSRFFCSLMTRYLRFCVTNCGIGETLIGEVHGFDPDCPIDRGKWKDAFRALLNANAARAGNR